MKDIDELNARLTKEGKKWRAVETPLSRLTPEQYQRMLGGAKQERPEPAGAEPRKTDERLKWVPGDPADSSVDWRNRNGKDCVSSVKAQGGCGTCTSFAVAGLMESMALIETGQLLDLSEADLHFCGSHAADCTGWDASAALADAMSRGVVLEHRFPYLSAFANGTSWGSAPSCKALQNHAAYAVKVSSTLSVYSVADRKSYLTNVGSMVAGITVYDEFFSYGSGVFSPSSQAKVMPGGHDLLIIGYSDTDACWIVKNSWDVSWGEAGFGRIAYGACDIDIETTTERTYFNGCGGIEVPAIVVDELIANIGTVDVAQIPAPLCCDGFYSGDDKMRHAIVGTTGGQVSEVFFNPETVIGKDVLGTRAGLVDIGAFYTDDDKMRHVIELDGQGGVFERYFTPQAGISAVKLATIPGAIRICGFYSADDKRRHAIVATSSGDIFEIFYGTAGQGQTQIGSIPGLIDICGFYTPDDNDRHVVVGAADGSVTEIFYHPARGISSTVIAHLSGLVKLGGFYTAKADPYSRRVLMLSKGEITFDIAEIRYSSANGIIINPLLQNVDAVDIAGFYSPDDAISHCMAALRSGAVREIFYRP
jgi:hypothetical protein